MKKLILLLICLICYCATCKAQEEPVFVNNFIYYNGDIYWQKVYYIDSLLAVRHFSQQDFIKQGENRYQWSGALHNFNDSHSSDQPNSLFCDCKIHFTVEIKKDRYRVIIRKIIFQPSNSISMHIFAGVSIGSGMIHELTLKDLAYTKKRKMKWQSGEKMPMQLNFTFENLFNANNTPEEIKIVEWDF